MTRNRDIALLQISDAAEQVVASTDDAVGGENSIADDGRSLLQARDGQQVFSASSREDGQIMLFTTPISYQNHDIGNLSLGMSTAALSAANRTAVTAMEIGRASCRERVCQYV